MSKVVSLFQHAKGISESDLNKMLASSGDGKFVAAELVEDCSWVTFRGEIFLLRGSKVDINPKKGLMFFNGDFLTVEPSNYMVIKELCHR